MIGSIRIGEFIPWLSWIDRVDGFEYRVAKVAKQVDDFLEQVIQEHSNGGLESEESNFVKILLDLYKENSIDRVSIKAIVMVRSLPPCMFVCPSLSLSLLMFSVCV